jgi:hypothetical protein
MTKSRNLIAPKHTWTGFQLDALRRLYPGTVTAVLAAALGLSVNAVNTKATALGLKKSRAFLASERSGRLGNGWHDGRGASTRWGKGQQGSFKPPKGVRLSPSTEFKPGSRPANWQPVGALRINGDGDLDIKVAEGLRCWVSMRRYVWETEVGPIPAGMLVEVRNGDGHDTQLSNLFLATRAEHVAHHLHLKYPKDLRSAMQLQGRLRNRIKALEGAQHG